ncbi:MAG TPA: tRNA (adenosine(37)-N6)-threonylcarbamoyltransferase complex dimerization subunit type 1 TsaB [Clostridia bacterium]|nr:tRNA (adenosine(37)-N6)-threonylcarbamoyltransferase complex dimerization subunit type 1 TsaB [Clostridia bacterium]
MKILALETSCEQASCALYIDGTVVEKKSQEDKRRHSSVLMPMVMDLLHENNLTADEIDLFAACSGPGSFTGIRIGMSAAKGMAFAANKPLASARSLDILAAGYNSSAAIVCPVIDARNMQVYTAVYEWKNGAYMPVTGYMGIHIEELAVILKAATEHITLCGDAQETCLGLMKEAGIRDIGIDPANRFPSAAVLAKMAATGSTLIKKGSAADILPFYLRESQAKKLYDKK